MERLTIRGASVELPSFEEDAELTSISTLRRGSNDLSNFVLNDIGMRALELRNAALRYGRISKLRTERMDIRQVDARSIHFSGCDLGKLSWTSGKLVNTLFEGCKLLGARFDGIIFDNVAFVGCKLDYSAFLRVRVSGPVIFSDSSFREAEFERCHFAKTLFDDCELVSTRFGEGGYADCDLRNNDLSAITGTCSLKSVVIDPQQLVQLGESIASELGVTFGDEPRVG